MKTYNTINELQEQLLSEDTVDKKLSFVPTMGNLHEGHLSLIRLAKQQSDCVIASIFVNPLQFGANEDLDKYPRTLVEDQKKLSAEGVDYLFTPQVEEIYPEGMESHTQVCVPNISEKHCGASRSGHFDGVSTIVNKLFNIVQPDIAIFGQKDFQQLAVIRKMVNDLCMPIEVIAAPTGRSNDGLALSSRNQYLNDVERQIAPLLYQTLQDSQQQLIDTDKDLKDINDAACKHLNDAGFNVDYFNICDAVTLEPATENSKQIVILVAAFLGQTRLIDNVYFPLNRITI